MKQRILQRLLLLFTGFLLVTSSYSQVTIGSSETPVIGALLDLKEDNKNGANAKRGLGLPRVDLQKVDELDMGAGNLGASEYAIHTGLVVFNLTETDPFCKGIYVWDGVKWLPISQCPCVAPVITTHPQSQLLDAGEVLTLTVSATGTNLTYQWKQNNSILSGETTETYTKAKVKIGDIGDYTCVVKNSCGEATSNKAVIDVYDCGSDGVPGTLTVGANTYLTYQYDKDCWMVSNSKEGLPNARYYENNPAKENGGYYTWAKGVNACPNGWQLPNKGQYNTLKKIVNADMNGVGKWWTGSNGVSNGAFAGAYFIGVTGWYNWHQSTYWWLGGTPEGHFESFVSGMGDFGYYSNRDEFWFAVRCVKTK